MALSNASNGVSVASSKTEPTPEDEITAANAAATGAFASRAKQALDAWQTLENALADVSSHAQVFSHVASAVDRQLATESEIQKKDARIANLQSAIHSQFDGFEARYSKWGADKKELEEKIAKKDAASNAKLKEVLQKNKVLYLQEMENLNNALEGEKKKSAALEGNLEDANLRSKKFEDLFAKCSQQVDEWNDYVSALKEVDFKKL